MLSPLVIALWLGNVVLDTTGQLAFKAAASDPDSGHGAAHWRYMLARPWIWLGVGAYVGQFVVWIAFLSLVPLSAGVLMASIDIVVIMLAGRWLFKEKLAPLRVAGILLVTLGVAVIGLAGGGA